MAFSHKISVNWGGGNRSITADNNYSGDSQESKDVTVAGSTSDMLINFALDVSQIKAIYILSDKDLTLETNNGTTPDDTISLKAGVPYIWTTDSYDTCKLTTNVTALYASNAGATAARLQLEVVKDDTP